MSTETQKLRGRPVTHDEARTAGQCGQCGQIIPRAEYTKKMCIQTVFDPPGLRVKQLNFLIGGRSKVQEKGVGGFIGFPFPSPVGKILATIDFYERFKIYEVKQELPNGKIELWNVFPGRELVPYCSCMPGIGSWDVEVWDGTAARIFNASLQVPSAVLSFATAELFRIVYHCLQPVEIKSYHFSQSNTEDKPLRRRSMPQQIKSKRVGPNRTTK